MNTVAPMPRAACAASAMFSVASSSWAAAGTPSTRLPYGALNPRTPSRWPMPIAASMLSRNCPLRAGIDSTPASGPCRSPAKKFSATRATPASWIAATKASASRSDGTGPGHGHQDSIAVKPAAAAAAGRRSNGSSVNSREQLAR